MAGNIWGGECDGREGGARSIVKLTTGVATAMKLAGVVNLEGCCATIKGGTVGRLAEITDGLGVLREEDDEDNEEYVCIIFPLGLFGIKSGRLSFIEDLKFGFEVVFDDLFLREFLFFRGDGGRLTDG